MAPLSLTVLRRALLLTGALGASLVHPARAQCPDGTPPPCGAAPARPVARPIAVAPPLDERNWIVVPFDNLARSSAVEWLRDASVNLLTLDLSRWTDIKVVDDKRVSDLVRELSRTAAAQLSLNDGLQLARRAGAGRLVMGEVLRLGSRTTVQARVINVRDGQRLRVVREETAAEDSLMPMFGRLAQKVLDVAPPEGANVGVIGTSRADAYQEYLAGVRLLRQFELSDSRRHLEAALKLDSTFALAHLSLSLLIGWENPASPEKLAHARAAERFGGPLPPHERALIGGLLSFYSGDYVRSCEAYAKLVQADSSDVLALYGLGDCNYHDTAVIPLPGDSTRFRFRGDWNVSLRAFQRALAVDPGFQLAFQHILDAFTTDLRTGCLLGSQPCVQMGGAVLASGDTLAIEVYRTSSPVFASRVGEARRSNAAERNLDRALEVALTWAASAPPEGRARAALGHIYLLKGKFADAERELDRAGRDLPSTELGRVLNDRIELAIKRWDAARARRYYDSIASVIPASGRAGFLAQYGVLFGRFTALDSLMAISLARGGASPVIVAYQRMIGRVLLGVFPDSTVEREAAAFAAAASRPGCDAQCRADQITPTLIFGLRLPRRTWPALDSGLALPTQRAAFAVSRGDSALVRAAVRELDSAGAIISRAGALQSGAAPLVVADVLLWLGDSLAAYQRTVRAIDSVFPVLPFAGGGSGLGALLMRAALLRADLAAALGKREDARLWYGRFLAFWSGADPEFAPLLDRVRKALQALGPNPP